MTTEFRHRGLAAAAVTAMAFLVVLIFGVARSEAYVYFTDDANDQISRAENDGSNVTSNFLWYTVDNPTALAIDGTEIYWVNNSDNSVRRANIDGSGETPLSAWIPGGVTSAWGVAIDPNYAYYTNVAGASIGRKNRATGVLNQSLVSSTGGQPLAVAVNESNIFWTNVGVPDQAGDDAIGRANLEGTGVNTNFITTGVSDPRSVVVSGNHVYWANFGSNSIGRANLDGSSSNGSFITGAHSPTALAVHGNYIYWGNYNPSSIGRANLDGTGVNQNFMPRSGFTSGIAVDDRVTPPTLTIDSGPDGPTTNSHPTFGFTAQAGSSVTCSVDQGTALFGPCASSTSHVPATVLGDGEWNFRVKAVNGLGGESTRTRQFTVDNVPPDTIIDSHPAVSTPDQLVGFEFHSTESGSYFQCRFDDGDWLFCSSPVNTYVNEGPQVFQVRATDGAGNVDPTPASFSFTSDRTGPDTTIDSGPEGTIDTDQATFTFSSSESPVQFRCKMDDGDEEDCTSPKTYTGLSNGDHVFEVYALDQLGNWGPTSETRSFTVNKTEVVDPDPPSNAFSFGKLKLNRKTGTAMLQVKTPGAGTVFLVGSKTVAPSLKSTKGKTTVTIPVKARGSAAKTLKKKGKVKLALKIRFTPTDGTAKAKAKNVKLIKVKPRK